MNNTLRTAQNILLGGVEDDEYLDLHRLSATYATHADLPVAPRRALGCRDARELISSRTY